MLELLVEERDLTTSGTTPTRLGVAPAASKGVVRLIALFVLGVADNGGRRDVGWRH